MSTTIRSARAKKAAFSAAAIFAVLALAELEGPVLERIVAACREQGATPIVSWAQVSPSYEWLRAWAGARGVAFADWAPAVAAVEAAMPAVPVDNHHSAGHHRGWVLRAFAEAYAKQIEAHPR